MKCGPSCKRIEHAWSVNNTLMNELKACTKIVELVRDTFLSTMTSWQSTVVSTVYPEFLDVSRVDLTPRTAWLMSPL